MHDLGPRIYSQTRVIGPLSRSVPTIHYQKGVTKINQDL